MELFYTLGTAALCVAALFALTRQIHMFQQNSYYPSRYMGWLKTAGPWRALGTGLLTAGCGLLLRLAGPLPFCGGCLLAGLIRIPFAVSGQKKAIKPLVFTARVKRMYVTAALLLAALTFLTSLLTGLPQRVLICLVLLLGWCTPGLLLAVFAVNHPVEKSIARWYVGDAKRILRDCRDLKVIGVTGSYGKTSTKYILGRILSERYNTVITPESFNTPLGVVRTVREKLGPGAQIFVCEMGAKNVGDIEEICRIANPSMGVITSIGPQHLETFGSIENVTATKFELCEHVLQNHGTVFLNTDNPYIAGRAADILAGSKITYGVRENKEQPAPGFYAAGLSCGRNGSSFEIVGDGRRVAVSTRLLGMHSVLNILAAASVAFHLGLTDSEVKYAVSQLKPPPHRLELKPFLNGSVLIDDAYNANPEGCLEAVRVLGSFDGMRKVIVTPGLVELGEKEYDCNYQLGLAAGKTCDVIILVGEKRAVPMADAVATLDFPKENLHIVKSFSDAMGLMRRMVDANTAVLFENDLPDNYAG
ncbi:MAG: UDP-N-acetylmuramoyl-tripeptide--D-alanyl-D-alanine ligase [Clostridiales bacterium]|nr:UDP-N-acetylmuramoyl-tripeptide--D-alanyl-D-alanine ligase [Clostridiales bacterium]